MTDIVQDGKLLAAALEAKKHHVHLVAEGSSNRVDGTMNLLFLDEVRDSSNHGRAWIDQELSQPEKKSRASRPASRSFV